VRVHGIDLSPDMVAQLQAKPGSDAIGVTIGDLATTNVGGTFPLADLVRNTITNLTTQDEQVACFRNVAAQLEPGGCFVIEVYIPELQRLPPGDTIHAFNWPCELGLMARLAGRSLRERWGDGTRAPFTSNSRSHVSVWEKPT
jgi:hypothetical protein